MAYDKTQLRLLVARTNAEGMNIWTLDSVDALATIEASGYISNALKSLANPGGGVLVGDQVIVRRWTDLASKIAANLVSITTYVVTAVVAAGATFSSPGGGVTGTATSTAGAATINELQGVITTELLTTAAGVLYTMTLTDSKIAAGDFIEVIVDAGASTGSPTFSGCVVTAGQAIIKITNDHASAAFNNTLKIFFRVIKV